MKQAGEVLGNCLAELDRDRKAFAALAGRFSKVSDLIAACVRNGQSEAAIELLERNRAGVTTLCELARKSAEQQIALAVKLTELARAANASQNEAPALDDVEQNVSRFVLSALDYLGGDPAAEPGLPRS